jgi:ribosomal protein L40E
MPGQRRDAESFGTITRTLYSEILAKARRGEGSGHANGYIRQPELAIRDAALAAWEYLSAKRVGEFVGKKWVDDVYVGLTLDKVRYARVGQDEVLQFYIRILKRGKQGKICLRCNTRNTLSNHFCKDCGGSLANAKPTMKVKAIWRWKSILRSDPFCAYIEEWINYLKSKGYQGRVFAISRQKAWIIMKNLGITNHINRHWRTTQWSSAMNPYELKEALDRATIPTEYVHGSPTKQLQNTKDADKEWQ